MDGKAEKLGRKRLLDVSGVIGIQLVLFGKPPMRPFGSLLYTADRIQFAKQNIAEAGRGDVKANGGKDFRLRIGLVTRANDQAIRRALEYGCGSRRRKSRFSAAHRCDSPGASTGVEFVDAKGAVPGVRLWTQPTAK
jgi:hypothetical protein